MHCVPLLSERQLLSVGPDRHHHDVYAAVSSLDYDVRENIIHYDEEGLGV